MTGLLYSIVLDFTGVPNKVATQYLHYFLISFIIYLFPPAVVRLYNTLEPQAFACTAQQQL